MSDTILPPGSYTRVAKAVRAIQYLGDNAPEVGSFHGETFELVESPDCCMALSLALPGGDLLANCGDWIVRDMRGTLTAVDPFDFEKDYELKEAQPA